MTATEISQTDEASGRRDALAGRIFEATVGALDMMSIYIGDKLGYYSALAKGAATSSDLAAQTRTNERYAREWLEQQAVTGILSVDDVAGAADVRRYSIPAGHDEVLLDKDSLAHMAPVADCVGALGTVLPQILDCFRTGKGIAWPDFGDDLRAIQEGLNRPLFINLLTTEYLPNIPAVHARLNGETGARVLDIACGSGWSSIAIAKAYPRAQVYGFDMDAAAIETARGNAAAAGISDRVHFEAGDAAEVSFDGAFDLVTVFEALHDMSRPVDALRTAKSQLAPGGRVLVMDEKVAERFEAPSNMIERFMYGASIVCCLPGGMADQPSAATGTVMRPSTLRQYATEAGFSSVEILPLEHDCFRFYELRP